jgi:5-methylthioadenosine/S-adenosylhomocysteine deaminase
MSVLFRNVHVLDLYAAGGLPPPTDVLVEGARIAAVGRDLSPPDPTTRSIDAGGHLLMPGLVNAHFHSSVNHMKGALPGLPLEIFMLYESPAL